MTGGRQVLPMLRIGACRPMVNSEHGGSGMSIDERVHGLEQRTRLLEARLAELEGRRAPRPEPLLHPEIPLRAATPPLRPRVSPPPAAATSVAPPRLLASSARRAAPPPRTSRTCSAAASSPGPAG